MHVAVRRARLEIPLERFQVEVLHHPAPVLRALRRACSMPNDPGRVDQQRRQFLGDTLVGERAFEKRGECGPLGDGQVERADARIDIRRRKIAAAVVKVHDFLDRGEAAVVHKRAADREISEIRGLEAPVIDRLICNAAAAEVIDLRPHADIMKRMIA